MRWLKACVGSFSSSMPGGLKRPMPATRQPSCQLCDNRPRMRYAPILSSSNACDGRVELYPDAVHPVELVIHLCQDFLGKGGVPSEPRG
jgi:hypothetical protein